MHDRTSILEELLVSIFFAWCISTSPFVNLVIGQMTSRYVEAKIKQFEKRFKELKKATRHCLEKSKIAVKRIVEALTDLSADDMDEHKQFLESHLNTLHNADNHSVLFGQLDFNWNYLSYELLDYLIQEFELDVKSKMETYKKDLQRFRERTPLTLFCRTQKRRRIRLSEDFQKMVVEFDWPEDVTLEVVEQFRQECVCQYGLRQCAMMLAEVRAGSFIVTWFIPESIVNKMRARAPEAIHSMYPVVKMEIADVCVFNAKVSDCNYNIYMYSCIYSDPFDCNYYIGTHGNCVGQ